MDLESQNVLKGFCDNRKFYSVEILQLNKKNFYHPLGWWESVKIQILEVKIVTLNLSLLATIKSQ